MALPRTAADSAYIPRSGAILDSAPISLYNAPLPPFRRDLGAQVAQLVEHVTENHGVGGSIPPLGTKIFQFCQLLGLRRHHMRFVENRRTRSSVVQVGFADFSSSKVTATAAFAERRTFCPSTSATRLRSIR